MESRRLKKCLKEHNKYTLIQEIDENHWKDQSIPNWLMKRSNQSPEGASEAWPTRTTEGRKDRGDGGWSEGSGGGGGNGGTGDERAEEKRATKLRHERTEVHQWRWSRTNQRIVEKHHSFFDSLSLSLSKLVKIVFSF